MPYTDLVSKNTLFSIAKLAVAAVVLCIALSIAAVHWHINVFALIFNSAVFKALFTVADDGSSFPWAIVLDSLVLGGFLLLIAGISAHHFVIKPKDKDKKD